jgi:hypothetical protein
MLSSHPGGAKVQVPKQTFDAVLPRLKRSKRDARMFDVAHLERPRLGPALIEVFCSGARIAALNDSARLPGHGARVVVLLISCGSRRRPGVCRHPEACAHRRRH